MKRKLINLLIVTALVVCAGCAIAGDKIDVSKVITKSDAEKILGVPVKDAKGRNQNGKGGYYDSEWSYHAIEHVLKGDILITIGIHGLPANAVLGSEKSMATKILANL